MAAQALDLLPADTDTPHFRMPRLCKVLALKRVAIVTKSIAGFFQQPLFGAAETHIRVFVAEFIRLISGKRTPAK